MERESTGLSSLQELLDQEAKLSYDGISKNEERMKIHTLIRLKRGPEQPGCFGYDDCSTAILSRCSWRMDCGV